MLMLSGATELKRAELAMIKTPEPTDTWRPLPHAEVVDCLTQKAAGMGLRVRNERFAVMPGALYPEPNTRIEIPGARLFGTMDFEPVDGLDFPAGCLPSAGLRNSHDKSFALSILSGARVLVCANGVLSAEHIITRKHTSGIDMLDCVDRALVEFMVSIRGFKVAHDRLAGWRVGRAEAADLVVEAARHGAFASSEIVPILGEFEEPQHPEFKERTAWNLYQAATQIMKKQSPARQFDGFKSLNEVFMPAPAVPQLELALVG